MTDVSAIIGAVGGLVGGVGAGYIGLRARSIERYRARLRSEGYEHETRFSRLHERRVEVIADLYAKLVDAEGAFGSWVHPLQEAGDLAMNEKAQRAANAGNDFRTTFVRNRIWLDEDLCERLEAFNRKLFEAFVEFRTYDPKDPLTRAEHLEAWQAAWHKVERDVPPLRREIESRFREMLGVIGPQ